MYSKSHISVRSVRWLVFVAIMGCVVGCSISDKQEPLSKLISQYTSDSLDGELASIEKITTRWEALDPVSTRRSDEFAQRSLTSDRLALAIPESKLPDTKSDVYLDWVRRDFPRFIREQQFTILSVEEPEALGNKAKVKVVFSNNVNPEFPWTFLFLKEGVSWKIVDITTNDRAKGFFLD
jgi:hypothetical protein